MKQTVISMRYMLKKQYVYKVSILLCCFIMTTSWSQNTDYTSIIKIEDYILNNQKDSATYYIDLLKQKENPYIHTLEALVNDKSPSFNHYYLFSARIYKNYSKSRDVNFFKFIEGIPMPTNKKLINIDYVYIKWLYILRLLDIAQLEKASVENEKLADYINMYSPSDPNYIRSKLLLGAHDIIISIIQRDEKGKAACIKNIALAKTIGDKKIEALYLSYLCDFYASDGNAGLESYIATAEKSIEIEKTLPVKTVVYESTMEKLIDGYLYLGGKNKEALELLETLYSSLDSRAFSYPLYANFLRKIDSSDPMNQKILHQFGVDNIIDFCKKIEEESVGVLNSNKLYYVLSQNSKLLRKRGFLNEAIAYMTKCIMLNRKIYSEDLANSLYDYKSKQEIERKELEIEYQKNKANLYTIIVFILVFAFIILMYIVYKMLQQAKELKKKNIKIEEQRDAILKEGKEKALLLKEVHHRVKNNFQIVSSLLELQTKGIQDEKALNLANDGKNRVKSMALIHQKLYQDDTGLIDFEEYIQALVKELSYVYASEKKVQTNINVKNKQFDVDTAIPLGLIINELITNAYKYAFDDEKENELNISINKLGGEEYKLIVADNGEGLDASINLAKVKSLGLRLVKRLTKQLQGKFTLNNTEGASFEITFKDTQRRALLD
ncbi:sensor histidine kinase [Kordia sp.]|uniref:sensor histidine kinase n=1 Tax=Kordia sp. TaxID=1965332 RepID=UPI003B591B08